MVGVVGGLVVGVEGRAVGVAVLSLLVVALFVTADDEGGALGIGLESEMLAQPETQQMSEHSNTRERGRGETDLCRQGLVAACWVRVRGEPERDDQICH